MIPKESGRKMAIIQTGNGKFSIVRQVQFKEVTCFTLS